MLNIVFTYIILGLINYRCPTLFFVLQRYGEHSKYVPQKNIQLVYCVYDGIVYNFAQLHDLWTWQSAHGKTPKTTCIFNNSSNMTTSQ